MPDNDDSQRGIVESTRRFYSLFSGWICSLTFKQLARLVKSPSSASHSKYFEELGSHSLSRMDREQEPIVLSSDDELAVDWTDDEDDGDGDDGDGSDRNLSKRSLPNWRTDSGVHTQPPLRTSSKKPYPHDAHRSWVGSAPSTSYGAGTHSMNSHAAVGNGSGSRAKMDDERFYRNNSSHTRDADYGQYSDKRTLPPSFESSRSRSKQNASWENLARNRGSSNKGSVDNAYMDSNHPRILPPNFVYGKAGPSADYTSTSDPYQNKGPVEDSVMGDERVIFQAALQDLSQPKSELDVPPGVLTVPLMRHQKIALAWMVEKESRTMHCLGGILADDQGLGKTISTIALILKQWPAQVKSKSKNNNNHIAEALTLDDDDDDTKGNKIEDINVGKCNLEEVSINGHKTLILDVDDDDDGSATAEDVKKMENVADDGNATAEAVQKMENVDDDGNATAEAVQKMENVDDDGNTTAEAVQKMDNVDDDDGNAIAEAIKEIENVYGSKSNSGSSSSHQTFNKQRPSAGTLIVCPATVLRQWHRELNEKVSWKAKLKVLSYHGGNRIKDPAKLANYDVVLTTYSIVANEVPKQPVVDEEDVEQRTGERSGLSSEFFVSKKRKNPSTTSKKGKKGKKLADSSLYNQAGALARVNWFRVVLDEAQTIKNHRTITARACCGLRAKRRWCLSGTPIQNSVDEMYSYFKFLRHQYYSSYKNFYEFIKNPISRDPNIGYKKLQAVLRTFLLRRTKDTSINGEPIISLPKKSIEMQTVPFTAEERAFYNQLEAESRSQFKAYAAAGTVNQNYANILLMILRLRQACDHPILVTGYNSESLRTNLDKARELPRQLLTELLHHLEAPSAICLICSDPAENAVVTICGHVFCYQCVGDYINGDDTQCPARRCKEQLSKDVFFSKATLKSCLSGDSDGSSSNENDSSNSSSVLSSEYSSSKIKAALNILFSNIELNSQSMERDEMREAVTENSMSVQVRTEKLEDSSSKGPIKTIVFSQWTRMLDLFENSLNLYCIPFRRLDGSMSLAARDRAVREFSTEPEITVMLMSLKAGNLGLNMVAACHVILLDLWWNPTTEDQAIDRAHRIGQTRPVTVSRITIKDTVEDRILSLQEEKRKIVASAFGEERIAGSEVKLTAEDLRFFLFGSRAF